MAAKKKAATKATTPKEQFLVLGSSCGNTSQLRFVEGPFETLEAAQKFEPDYPDDYKTMVIARVVDVGRLGKVTWGAKLED